MNGKKQQNTDMIEIRLKQAFTKYAFAAYMLLARWTDDFIYIYANGIRKLTSLMGERTQTCIKKKEKKKKAVVTDLVTKNDISIALQ